MGYFFEAFSQFCYVSHFLTLRQYFEFEHRYSWGFWLVSTIVFFMHFEQKFQNEQFSTKLWLFANAGTMRPYCCTMRTECCTTPPILAVIVQNSVPWLLGKRELKRCLLGKRELNSRITKWGPIVAICGAQEENDFCGFYIRRYLKTRIKGSFYRRQYNVTKSLKIHNFVLARETEIQC